MGRRGRGEEARWTSREARRASGMTRSKDAVAQRWGMEGGAEKDQVEVMQRERPRRPEEKDEGIGLEGIGRGRWGSLGEGLLRARKRDRGEMGIGMRARATLSWRRYEARRRRRGSGLGGSGA